MSLPIKITQVTKRFGPRLILDQVTLAIQPGETVALIGPSGGGKSTLLRCLNGLNWFDAGEIRIGEHVLSSGKRGHGPNIRQLRMLFGMVFQDFQLFPHMTALQNVMEAPVQVLGMKREKAMERGRTLLERVGLHGHLHARPSQLSGGQKQRVAIARALAMGPQALLCDEITSSLDPEMKNEVLAVLEDLNKDGLTLILVTHEIGFARKAADRLVFLESGKILEEGPPHQVLEQPRTQRLQTFLHRVLG